MSPPTEPEDTRGRVLAMVAVTAAGLIALAWTAQRRADRGEFPGVDLAPAIQTGLSPLDPGMTGLGAQVLSHALVDPDEGQVFFTLNGVEVGVISGESSANLEDVMAAARSLCAAAAPLEPFVLADALRAPPLGLEAPVQGELTMGGSDGTQAYLTCLERIAPPPARGAMRYVYARTAPSGTSFVVVFTEQPVLPADLAPERPGGDVRGQDLEGLPRPPGATRDLAFARRDGRQALVVYGGAGDVESMQRWAQDALPAAGWSAPRVARGEAETTVIHAQMGSRALFLVLSDSGSITLIEGPVASGPPLP